MRRLSRALAWEASRTRPVVEYPVQTPVADTVGHRPAKTSIIVPVLRAGLFMSDGVCDVLEGAGVACIGMSRNEATLEAQAYLAAVPENMAGCHVVVCDPMLATGGSLVAVGDILEAHGAEEVTALVICAAPEGIARLEARFPDWTLHVAAIDDHLNDRGYIVPGLGDAGDRLCGL